MDKCNHEDGQILFGKVVFEDSKQRVLLMMHDLCKATGATYEKWDKAENDWAFASEEWNEASDYLAESEEK